MWVGKLFAYPLDFNVTLWYNTIMKIENSDIPILEHWVCIKEPTILYIMEWGITSFRYHPEKDQFMCWMMGVGNSKIKDHLATENTFFHKDFLELKKYVFEHIACVKEYVENKERSLNEEAERTKGNSCKVRDLSIGSKEMGKRK